MLTLISTFLVLGAMNGITDHSLKKRGCSKVLEKSLKKQKARNEMYS